MLKRLNWQFVVPLFVLGFGVSVRSASAGETGRLNALDAQISSATARISALEALLKGVASESGVKEKCRQSFSVSALMTRPTYAVDFPGGETEQAQTVVKYFACHALLLGDRGSCFDRNPEIPDCKDLFDRLLQTKVVVTAATDPAGAKRLCTTILDMPPGSCEIMAAGAADAHELATKLAPLYAKYAKWTTANIEEAVRQIMGLAQVDSCRAFNKGSWPHALACTTARAYRMAAAKRDPSLCGDSGLCLALMGRRMESCERYSDSIRESVCAKDAAAVAAAGTVHLSEAIKASQQELKPLWGFVDGRPYSDREVKSRRRQVSALIKRCDAMMRTLSGKTAPAKKLAPAKIHKTSDR